MSVVGLGMAELVIILGLGGGMGLPLGVPPAPEDPLMAKVAPEECLFYTTWAGMAEPNPGSENHVEQLLAEPEVQHMIAEVERVIKSALGEVAQREGPETEALAQDAAKWVKTLLTHATALFVSSVEITPAGPDVRAGAVVHVGEDAPRLKASLEKYQGTFLPAAPQPVQIRGDTWYRIKLDPRVPVITWGVKDKYFVVGVGEGSVDSILDRARTPMPEWLVSVRQQLPVDRTATVSYVNLKAIIDTFAPMAGGPQVQAILAVAGLGNVNSLAAVTGLDEEGFVSRTLLGIDDEPQGLLRLVADKPLGPDDLAPIPSDATIALAARIDADQVFETVLSVVEKIEPRARENVIKVLDDTRQQLGFDLRDDVLQSLGDTWCVYNSPSEGGLVITGLTGVVQLKDHEALADAHAKFVTALDAELRQDTGRRRSPRIEQFQFAGQDVYFLNIRNDDFPLAPAWCLTENELIVATFPQNIKAHLSRGEGVKSLDAVPEVAGLFESAGGPAMLSYADTPKLFELLYPFVPAVTQVAMSKLAREGIDINVSILPSAAAIGKHLRPSVAVVRRSEAGIELTSRQSLPGGNIGTTAPVGVALLLPAVQAARAAARRAKSMNNMKQIALAMHIHLEAYGTFPPAYSSDKDGKPLLSWRVQILPFIEQQALYERFHLDEPWDSENNKRLIPLMPQLYKAPSSKAGPSKTNYLAVRGENTAFPGKDKISIRNIPDGTSLTIMVVEASDAKAVLWTKPDDFEYDEKNPVAGLVGLRHGGFNAVFCDGSVHFLSESIDKTVLNALFTRNGGEVVDRGRF